MAYKYTDTIYITSARFARGYVEASISSQTDTTATISWKIVCQQKQAALYGQTATCSVDGTQRGSCEGYIESSSSDWKNVCSKSGTTTVNKTSSSRSVPVTIKTRVEPVDGYGSVTSSYESATCYVTVSAITYYAPNAPSGLTNTRESDAKNVLKWTKPSTSTTKPVTAILIERKVDGGSWSQIASVSATATSYNDTTTAADHSYAYRIRSKNSAGNSSYVTSGTTYNTPAAPTGITAARLAETTVKLTIANGSNTATALELQRSTDASSWVTVATINGSPVTETTDASGGGTFYYRARNTRDGLASAWSATSNAVVTICAPDAPTLVSPASGVAVNKAAETITFEWKHSPIDGSAQTAAEISYSLDNGSSWQVIAVSGNTALETITNAFNVNSKVTWRVRTKGVHEDYSAWSNTRVFYVYQQPTIAIAEPTDGFVIENTPVHVALQYADGSGTLANATLTISDGSKTVYTRNMGNQTECDITTTEWLPEDGKTYTMTVNVRSSSTLTASATREVAVSFFPPQPATLEIKNDPETGYVRIFVDAFTKPDSPQLGMGALGSMKIGEGEESKYVAAVSMDLYRVYDGERVLIADGLHEGSSVVDKHAPLNMDYTYESVTFAESGAANGVEIEARVPSLWWFVYYDDGMAKAMWEPSGSRTPRRTRDELKERDGSEWPVLIQGKNKSHKVSFSGWVETKEEADAFEKMTFASGDKVYKGLKGEVFHCHAEADITDNYEHMEDDAEVKVSITRVRGGAL